ncbi:MAG: hypothetical protein RMK99_13180, partial [Anaerolineales bacterium]|nr:hypothetical protein [Anaerolineales bacterium]
SYKIPATVASRCQRFEFRRIPVADVVARLQSLCVQEGIKAEKAALELVARQSTGALRDAISLLDQLVSADGSVTLAQAQMLLGAAAGESVQRLSAALAVNDTTACLNLLNAVIDSGTDPRQFARQMVDYLRALLLIRLGNAALIEATTEDRLVMSKQAEQWTTPRLLNAIRALSVAANEARGGWQPQLPLELAIVEITSPVASEPATVAPESLPVERTPSPSASPVSSVSTPRPTTRSTLAAGGSPASAWQRTLDLLLERKKLSRLTKSELERSTVERLEDSCLYIVTSASILSRLKERPEFQTVINDALSEVMGAPHRVKFQLGEPGRGKSSGSGGESPGGLVAAALDLGGQIVE